MFGTNTQQNEKLLYNKVSTIYARHKEEWEKVLSKYFPVTLHINRKIPYSMIKESREICGKNADFTSTTTDSGKERTSNADGGVIYAKINNLTIPLAWFEVKSSNSSTAKAKSRGQATGLIAEQAARCMSWVEGIDFKIKPLIVFMQGTDFIKEDGEYNINRIRDDLHTVGNCNPYEEDNKCNVSWFFFQKEFTEEELESYIYSAIATNIEKMEAVIHSLVSIMSSRI